MWASGCGYACLHVSMNLRLCCVHMYNLIPANET